MEKPNLKEGMLKIPTEVTSVRLVSFSFVPAVKKLPAESTVTTGEQERQPMRRSNENLGKQKEVATGQTMSGDGVFKAEFVHVGGDSDEGVPMDHRARLARETNLRQEAHSQLKLTADHMTHGQLTPSQITAPSESTAHLSVNISPALKLAVLETANDKHCSMDAHGHNTSFGSKVCPILLLNQAPDKRKTLISDCRATHSAELLETPASSRESVLSEDWFGPHTFSSEGSPASLSRTISPCSSVRSGVFSPSVIRVKRHSLAPGSSLAWNLQPCLSPASSSPAPSPYSLSPRTGRSWQRPPPTHLTLLTAILRKGRLPVLSSVQQRAYSPCWPISAASLSSCSACNAAAKMALICPSVARSQSQTPMEVHRAARHMPMHGPKSQPLRCLTPPPSPDSEATNFGPPAQLLSHSHEFGSRSSSTDSTLQRVPSPSQQCRVPSLSQQCRITSLTQQRTAYPVNSVTQQSHGASPVSPSDHVTTATPALQNLPFSNKPDPTPPILSNPVLSSSFSRLRSLSPKCCSPTPCATGDCPAPSPVPKLTYSPVPREATPPTPHLPTIPGSLNALVHALCISALPSSSDRAGRQRKYKIKSSYKALAAIPTNTLLLEQQTIDDEVEKEVRPLDDADVDCVTETHSEMCSPSQLRQQSEELYAAIDQVLQDPLPMRRSHSAPQSLVTLTDVDVEVSKRLRSLPRSAGRETKYATFHLQPSGSTERNMTKPGVIRPVAVIPKLTEEDDEEEDFPNPFRQQYLEEISEQQSQKFGSTPTGQIPELSEDQRDPGSPTFRKGDIPREDELVLLITEKEETHTPPVAEGSSKIGPTSFNPAQVKTEVRETHI
ncbi:hypothetical protein SKAU_G00165360 [Synaphobranchus kaupii]|uniref:Muscular LMNA-interacting protein n=1 Tax=Synaphobranchus kaupii TaxID=118154 RepID=A0A9Q1FJG7_SYNKA|nr:hypothetical protein SKAU_G00165360 [Synaphobranchus kaupii]